MEVGGEANKVVFLLALPPQQRQARSSLLACVKSEEGEKGAISFLASWVLAQDLEGGGGVCSCQSWRIEEEEEGEEEGGVNGEIRHCG